MLLLGEDGVVEGRTLLVQHRLLDSRADVKHSGLPYFYISGYHMRYAERLSALRLLDRSVVGDGRVVH